VRARAGRWGDPRWQLLGFALAHVAIFAGLFRGVYSMPFSGTGLYYDYGSALAAGHVPYRDFFVEYPPLALAFFTLPRLAAASFRWYYVWYQVQIVAADLVILAALYAARPRESPPWRVLGAYTGLLLAVGPITLQQYDIFPAAFTVLAVAAFARRRDAQAAFWLALGFMAKIYPLLLAPVFLTLDTRPDGRHARAARAALVFIATCTVILLPLLIAAPASLGGMYAFHAQRGIHLDSVYSTVVFAARALGLTIAPIVFAFRSWNIGGPLADVLTKVSPAILAAVLLAAYWHIARSTRPLGPDRSRDVGIVAASSSLVLAAGLVGSKVLSPQYLVWLVPLLPLTVRPRRRWVWGAFGIAGLLTYYIYPLHYPQLLARQRGAIAALAARNLLLVTLAFLVAQSIRLAASGAAPRGPSAAAGESPV